MGSEKWRSYEVDDFEEDLRDSAPLSEEDTREIDALVAEMDDDAEDAEDAADDAEGADNAHDAGGADKRRHRGERPDPRPLLIDPTRALPGAFMSRTETCLRLARHLLVSGVAASDVYVSLSGYELTRRGKPHFPAALFLGDRGFVRRLSTQRAHEWCGEYASKDSAHSVHLVAAANAADVVTNLADGRRLLVHASRGSLHETRSSGEHKVLRGVIGRALTFERYEPTDIPAVAVPRSASFHRLASAWRRCPLVQRAGIQILTVDRAGNVSGLIFGQ